MVGARAVATGLFADRPVAVSRVAPDFVRLDGSRGPLRDAYLSRDPTVLFLDRAGLRVDCRQVKASVRVDGEVVTEATWVDLERLERGVTLELADRVLLLLHRARAERVQPVAGIVGQSDAIVDLWDEIRRAGSHAAPVLIRGESGSGKELVAQAIHASSGRAGKPFLCANMAAISPTTAVAELFGHRRGAFTGAAEARPGWFGNADGGTLFLDEIGETPQEIQPMLLRVLETGEIQPVGSPAPARVNVRVLAATDAALEEESRQGKFRFPLLQRLAAHTVTVAPLRQRRADIGLLLVRFLSEEMGGALPTELDPKNPWLPSSLVARALEYEWPGNVRELRNFARELVVSRHSGAPLRVGKTFQLLLPSAAQRPVHTPPPSGNQPQSITEERLLTTLRQNRFRIGATARALGIAKNTLYQLMEQSSSIRRARDLTEDEIRAVRAATAGDTSAMAAVLEVSERGLKLRMRELNID